MSAVFRIFDVDAAVRGVERAVTGLAGWGNAVKRVAAAASALLLCGSLTACRHTRSEPDESVMGNMQYEPPVSGSDASSEDMLTLDGEEQYFPVEGEDAGDEDPESQSGF